MLDEEIELNTKYIRYFQLVVKGLLPGVSKALSDLVVRGYSEEKVDVLMAEIEKVRLRIATESHVPD